LSIFGLKSEFGFAFGGGKKKLHSPRKRIASKTQGKAFKGFTSRELLEGVFEK